MDNGDASPKTVMARSPWWVPWLFAIVLIFVWLGYSLASDRGAIADDVSRCLLAQLVEHRHANRSAHLTMAEHMGVTYEVDEDQLPRRYIGDLNDLCEGFLVRTHTGGFAR